MKIHPSVSRPILVLFIPQIDRQLSEGSENWSPSFDHVFGWWRSRIMDRHQCRKYTFNKTLPINALSETKALEV
jgi:hypothetical protein